MWYPASDRRPATVKAAGGTARPAAHGSFPLVIFGPGFDLYPASYASLLRAWAQAGYVVAAPVFPLTNPGTPGGPDESDIVNQPKDMRLVIGRMLRVNRAGGPFHGLIDASAIAVSGQSDGASTALTVAYSKCCRDPRIDAAIIMAGAEVPPVARHYYPPGSPPLLAIQGSADPINPPSRTLRLYQASPSPKYLLWLKGADHLEPFTRPGPYERIVRRISTEFLARYLGEAHVAVGLPPGAGERRRATLTSVLS